MGSHRPQPAAATERMRPGALAALGAAALLALSCSGTLPLEAPEERGPGTPLARSAHLRSASLTWRLGEVERTGDGIRVDFTLQNGSSRDIDQGLLRILLHGPGGELVSARLPFVGLARGKSRPMAAHFPPVPFRIQDMALELIFAVP